MVSAPKGGGAVPGVGVGLEEEAAMLRQSARSSYRLPLSALVIRSS
eukprot:CAMPEP_0179176610 /NCGR_PEP_ID=MMETSP0796-20121207/87330_1 /TAXON_ID=73915 /ORGANISM="Pyrodinium bahamense, Strain pbaha01" /LENGTH=45 /DNA_ID= /DNA_START= /DNA_END= /DNA_ORIENTATION=